MRPFMWMLQGMMAVSILSGCDHFKHKEQAPKNAQAAEEEPVEYEEEYFIEEDDQDK